MELSPATVASMQAMVGSDNAYGIAFRDLVDGALDMVMVTDATLDAPGPYLRYVNPAFTRLTGWRPEEVFGRSPRFLQGPGTDRQVLAELGAALRKGEKSSARLLNYARDGAPYWADMRIVPLLDRRGRVGAFAGFARDVTFDKRRLDELEQLADRDVLTGLLNRRALLRTAEREFAAHGGGRFCFAWLDIDHFKRVNDRFGHPAGDAVLMEIADVLARNVRRADVIGRMGGEEFAVCMPDVGLDEARAIAQRLRGAVAAAATPAQPLRVTCSIGVARSRAGDGLRDVMARADAALYEAKQAGRNRVSSV